MPSFPTRRIQVLSVLTAAYGCLNVFASTFALLMMIRIYEPVNRMFGGPGSVPTPLLANERYLYAICAFAIFLGALSLLAAYCIRVERFRVFVWCVVILECLNVPLGTLLAVYTLVTLLHPPTPSAA